MLGGNASPSAADISKILDSGAHPTTAASSYAATLAIITCNYPPCSRRLQHSSTLHITVGLEANGDEVSKLLADLEGKDINEVIKEGLGRLSSVPSGGAVAAGGGAPAAGGAAGGAAEAAKEEAKAEEEEEDDDMGFSLFD